MFFYKIGGYRTSREIVYKIRKISPMRKIGKIEELESFTSVTKKKSIFPIDKKRVVRLMR